jgi:hypothetical protein
VVGFSAYSFYYIIANATFMEPPYINDKIDENITCVNEEMVGNGTDF